MKTYIPKLVGYLKSFRKSKPKTKELLGMIREWRDEFESEALYGNYIDHNNAKHKYILMRWNDWETEKNSRPSRPVHGSYEDEELGIWYCGGERVER